MIPNDSTFNRSYDFNQNPQVPINEPNTSSEMGQLIHRMMSKSAVPPVTEQYYVQMITLFKGNIPLSHALIENLPLGEGINLGNLPHFRISSPTNTSRSSTPSDLGLNNLSRGSSQESVGDTDHEDTDMSSKDKEDVNMSDQSMDLSDDNEAI